MKLEVKDNMFVRTKGGNIYKILDVEEEIRFKIDLGIEHPFWHNGNFDNEILKASHNVINLIEVGDIVVDNSGRKFEVNLIRIWNDEKELICNDYNLDDSALTLHSGGIFKVLTHEQFEKNCFRIGD